MRPPLPAHPPRRPARVAARAVPGLVLCLAAGVAIAQYKVVGPDGQVTYTDRPPAGSTARVTPLGAAGGAEAVAPSALPFELQKIAQRFPVTLYTSADCTPCDAGRQLLQQRGIPFAERTVTGSSNDEVAALERATGGRSLPALTIGAQALAGFAPSQWSSYLDAAGYPRESRLPRGWAAPAPTPLVERKPAVAAVAAPAASAPAPAAPLPQPASGIRF